jgi:hypothetical protein
MFPVKKMSRQQKPEHRVNPVGQAAKHPQNTYK